MSGVNHGAPVQSWIAALFIADTVPLRDLAVRDHHRSVGAALAPARFECALAGCVTLYIKP